MTRIWPVQGSKEFVELFGNPDANGDGAPDPGWVANHLTTIVPPYQMFYGASPIKRITVNKACSDALLTCLKDIRAHYGSQAAIEKVGMHRFSGVYNFRPKRGGKGLSMHSYAAAIDMDAEHNPFHSHEGTMPMAVVEIFEAEGATWGGRWSGKSADFMHYQFARVK